MDENIGYSVDVALCEILQGIFGIDRPVTPWSPLSLQGSACEDAKNPRVATNTLPALERLFQTDLTFVLSMSRADIISWLQLHRIEPILTDILSFLALHRPPKPWTFLKILLSSVFEVDSASTVCIQITCVVSVRIPWVSPASFAGSDAVYKSSLS